MTAARRAFAEGLVAALAGYTLAVGLEATVIRSLQPTEWELAWISDVALAAAFGVAVSLWRHLLTTRTELAGRERAELVLETQLSVAADIQRRLLPALPPSTSGLECAADLRSAGKIGGDFYDFLERDPGVWVVFVGDVSGKGIPAAMALGSLRSTFRALARQRLPPAEIAAQLSTLFLQEWDGVPYVTCLVVTFDLPAHTLTYTNAGHPCGLLTGRGGVRRLDLGGPPVGVFADAHFEQETLLIHPGDTYVLMTDGVTEAVATPQDLENLLDAADVPEVSAAELCQQVMAQSLDGHGLPEDSTSDDDRTVVVVRCAHAPRATHVSSFVRWASSSARHDGRGGTMEP